MTRGHSHAFNVIALKKGAAGKPEVPREVRLFRFGDNETVYGTFRLDEKGAEELVAKFAAYGNDLVVDFDHQSFTASAAAGPVPAAGWIKQGGLTVKEGDGLFASVEWTEEAEKRILAKEYRYTSPSFTFEGDQIRELLPLGLTNYPGTIGMEPLIAARRPLPRDARKLDRLSVDGGPSFDEVRTALDRTLGAWAEKDPTRGYPWVLEVFDEAAIFQSSGRMWRVGYSMNADGSATLTGDAVEVVRVYETPAEAQTMKVTLSALGLQENTSDNEAAKTAGRYKRVTDEVIRLSGLRDPDEALGALSAAFEAVGKLAAAEKELETMRLSRWQGEEKALLDAATKDLKITPAEADALSERPGANTEPGVKWLSGFLSKKTAKAPNASTGAGIEKPAKTTAVRTEIEDGEITKDQVEAAVAKLSAKEKAMAKRTGMSFAEYATSKLRMKAEGRLLGGRRRDEDEDDE